MRHKIVLKLFTIGVLASAPISWAQTVTVNAGTTYQTISGFGAASVWVESKITAALANTFYTDDSSQPPANQVNGNVGLSVLRIVIDDSGNSNWGTACNSAKQALAINSNMRIFASPWSPPAKWKNNNKTTGNNTGNDNGNPGSNTNTLITGDYAAYATYITSFATACKNTYGFTPYAISVQNEPDYDVTYDSCLWSAQNFDTFIGTYLGPDLQAAGFSNIIMMPESFADNLNLAATTMGDSNAAKYVKIIATHLYGGGPNTMPASYSTTAGHAVESWETEYSMKTSDGNIDSGLFYSNSLHSCIVDHNFNAWCYWWLVNDNTDDEGLCDSSGNPTKRLYCLGNYSKFIRPGFVRISCTEAPAAGVSVSAYYSSSANKVVVVAINNNGSAANLPVTFSGLSVSTVYPWITDSSRNLVQQTSVAVSGGGFTYSLPSQSVCSFVGTASGGTPVPTATLTMTPTPIVSSTWRVNAGGPAYTDTLGNVWAADENYNGGSTIASGGTITGTSDSTLYDTQRYGSSFSYSFNVPAGSYQITLKFAETYSGDDSTGARVFNVAVNGTTVLSNLDVYAQVGANTAGDKVINNVSPSGGVITIQFTGTTSTDTNAVVEAIQIIPMPSSTPTSTPSSTPTASATRTYTATSTASPTSTPTPTATGTPSPTRTNTPSSTPTGTFTSSPTATRTNTSANTPTSTATGTPSVTRTSTSSNTPTGTPTSSPTASRTATPSATNTPTATSSSTATRTPTQTASSTPTSTPQNTFTLTPSSTSTGTPTNTFTRTATLMATNTPSATPSSTRTSTPTSTSTSTSTPTASPSSTSSSTPSSTATRTSTPTASSTVTNTPQFTYTPTSTLTASPSSTPSGTATNTATNSPTRTPTSTATSTPSSTPQNTFTPTSTPSSTPTKTFTNTSTPTASSTATSSFTPTSTPTAVTVEATQGINPPGNSNQLSGATNVPVQQVVLTNPSTSTVTLTSLTLTVSGTGNPSNITSVTLLDNGTPVVTTTFTYTTATFSLSQTLLGSSSVTYTVLANFGTNAAGGYTFSLTGASGSNGQAVLFSGLPVAGATVSVAQATSTPTNSYTPTTTATNTPSATDTLIATLTFTPTFTSTPSHTSTSTPNPPTSTATSTPVGNTGVVVYPNPAKGDTVNVLPPAHAGMADVRVEIFTSGFRKVQDEVFASVPPGVAVTVELKDRWGRPLADGLYYVLVTVDGKRSFAKLLVLN